jgi:glycosyltransferase involved in cell wall biosynthesis
MKKKIFLIAYYWPPSGGPGVQRWLKMSYYLAEMGHDITVLTVDPGHANYPNLDEGLVQDVHPKIRVVRSRAFNPYRILSWWKKDGTDVASNFSIPKKAKWKFKLLAIIRTHLFIPDPRRGWNRYALAAGRKLMRENTFDTVISTSPPHSTQLIGWKLKKEFGVKWIVDFRDPWSGIIFYHELGHSFASRALDRNYERKVVDAADTLIVVGEKMGEDLTEDFGLKPGKVQVVHNGFDSRDFKSLNPEHQKDQTTSISCEIYGKIHSDIQEELLEIWPNFQFMGEVKHGEVNKKQQRADLLVMAIADVPNAEHVVSGKLFEYLKSGNPILCMGPKHGDAAKIIEKCGAGQTFGRSEEREMCEFIRTMAALKERGTPIQPKQNEIAQFSREALAQKIAELL